jgi:hypothetical protein
MANGDSKDYDLGIVDFCQQSVITYSVSPSANMICHKWFAILSGI